MTAHPPIATGSQADKPTEIGATYAPSLGPDAFLSLGCMEGLYESIVEPVGEIPGAATARESVLPGYALAGGIGALALGVHYLPFAPFSAGGGATATDVRHPISAAIIAILLGLALRNTAPLPDSIKAGCKRIVKKGIPIAIVCMGAGLNLGDIASVGITALFITVLCIGVALAAGYYCGRLFGLGPKTSLLLGVGTGICGNSAIVAAAPLIDAEDDDLVLSVGTVNLFGLLAMLVLPLVGARLGLTNQEFGVWSGASIHAVPQVVAAGFAYSPEAGALATLVKLVRVALLAPMIFLLAIVHARHESAGPKSSGRLTVHYARLVPWFVWGFVLLAILNTFGLIPTLKFPLMEFLSGTTEPVSVSIGVVLSKAGKIMLTLAMAAIGLEVSIRHLAGVGGRAIAAGLASTVALATFSLLLILLLL